jgi:uncharacterized protein involved in response to NO
MTAGKAWTGLQTPRSTALAALALLWLGARIAAFLDLPYAGLYAVLDLALLPVVATVILVRLLAARRQPPQPAAGRAARNAGAGQPRCSTCPCSGLLELPARVRALVRGTRTDRAGRMRHGRPRGPGIHDECHCRAASSSRVRRWTRPSWRASVLALACPGYSCPRRWPLRRCWHVAAVPAEQRACWRWKPLAAPAANPSCGSCIWPTPGFRSASCCWPWRSSAGSHLSAGIHALAVGATGGLIIGMVTRTARGHTGRPLLASPLEVGGLQRWSCWRPRCAYAVPHGRAPVAAVASALAAASCVVVAGLRAVPGHRYTPWLLQRAARRQGWLNRRASVPQRSGRVASRQRRIRHLNHANLTDTMTTVLANALSTSAASSRASAMHVDLRAASTPCSRRRARCCWSTTTIPARCVTSCRSAPRAGFDWTYLAIWTRTCGASQIRKTAVRQRGRPGFRLAAARAVPAAVDDPGTLPQQ